MTAAVIATPAASAPALAGLGPELFSRWVSFIDAKPKTVETYTKSIRQFARYLADNGITAPGYKDVLAYRNSLDAQYKPSTVNGYLAAVKKFFSWTEVEGLYKNVAREVHGSTVSRNFKKDALTIAQAKDVLAGIDRSSLKGLRDYAIVALMLSTGLRTIEVSRANIEDFRTTGGVQVLYVQGKGKVDREDYVKVSAPVEKAIRAYLAARGKADDREPLFASTANLNRGGRLTTVSVSSIAKAALRGAGLDSSRLTAHSLRHTAATINIERGGTAEETQQLLRHADISTTMIYIHAYERSKNMSEDRISAALF